MYKCLSSSVAILVILPKNKLSNEPIELVLNSKLNDVLFVSVLNKNKLALAAIIYV